MSLAEAQGNLSTQETRILGAKGEAGTRIERLNAHRNQERKLDSDVVRLVSEVATQQANRAGLESQQASMKEKFEALDVQGNESSVELERMVEALRDASELLRDVEEKARLSSEWVASLSAQRVEADANRDRVEQAFRMARQQANEQDLAVARLESRIKSLEELQEAHAGVSEGARRFLEHSKSRGSLAEHLDVRPEDERLAQALLGPWLNCVLVDTIADVELMLEELGEGDRGALLCLEDAPSRSDLSKRFSGSERGEAALAILLSGWEESETLSDALEHGRAFRGALLPDQSVVSPGGILWTGQSSPDASTAVLRRRRQLADLHNELVEQRVRQFNLSEALGGAQTSRDDAQKARNRVGVDLEEARSKHRDCEIAVAQARNALAEKQREENRRKHAHDTLGAQRTQLSDRLLSIDGELAALKASLASSEAMCEASRAALGTHRAEGEAIEGEAAEARESLARSESERKGAADRVDLLESTFQGVERRRLEMKDRVEELSKEQGTAEKRIETLEADDLRLGESISAIESQQNTLREKLGMEGSRLKIARERVGEMEEHLRGLRKRREEAQTKCTRIEMELQEVRVRIETVRDQIQQRYELSLAAMLDQMDREGHILLEAGAQATADLPIDDSKLPEVGDFPVRLRMLENESLITEWVERVQESRKKVEMLGEVNLAALEEFVELRARHTYLEEQRQDLEDSVAAIRKAIAQINRTCRERFRDAYDQVNSNFQNLYPRLVGGGSARLQLTNEDDLLETGVEILAQPPGKRLQNLSLLSGGEKAMTALALIFSLFQVKPSPFCLLDEVDAPLDDSNGARFNQMLREMSAMSQFIVITHNKKTMEVMDTLYGVTMPKPGQSRLVTVQIH